MIAYDKNLTFLDVFAVYGIWLHIASFVGRQLQYFTSVKKRYFYKSVFA